MKKIELLQLGYGTVGAELVKLIRDRHAVMKEQLGLDVRLCGVATSTQYAYDAEGIDSALLGNDPKDFLKSSHRGWNDLKARFGTLSDYIVVDVTASSLGSVHRDVLRSGGSIVTANKKPLTDTYDVYRQLHHNLHTYFYETTVGSTLPVVQCLQDMVATGDEIIEIQATLSGTLGFLCSELRKGELSFSEIVVRAKEKGFTEPHPRDDLSGMDVARKALILGREIGLELEISDITLEGLLPEAIAKIDDVGEFLEALKQLDDAYRQKVMTWREQGRVPQFVARISHRGIIVGLEGVIADSPLGRLTGPDNLVAFTTRIFKDNPMILQGRGAGALFTAEGVLQDIIRASEVL